MWKHREQLEAVESTVRMVRRSNTIRHEAAKSADRNIYVEYRSRRSDNIQHFRIRRSGAWVRHDKRSFQCIFYAENECYLYERYTFNKLNQVEEETFEELFTKVKTQSTKCELTAFTDRLVRGKMIIGIRSEKIREKLLSEEVTLDRAMQIGRASELASSQLKSIRSRYERLIKKAVRMDL